MSSSQNKHTGHISDSTSIRWLLIKFVDFLKILGAICAVMCSMKKDNKDEGDEHE